MKTKITVPGIKEQHLRREAIAGILEDGFKSSPHLTIISAPPGYGKTCALSSWISDKEEFSSWLTLDRGDNEPADFIYYLVFSIRARISGFGQILESYLASPVLPPPDQTGAALISEIENLENPLILVLDDYHVISNDYIHTMLQYVFRFLPANLNIIISTRHDPPFQLGRLRMESRLSEIRSGDLSLDKEEIARFLNSRLSLEFNRERLEIISEKTEGWIAAIELLVHALAKVESSDIEKFIFDFNGSNKFVIDYLMEEVFDQMDGDEISLLSSFSLFDRFSRDFVSFVLDEDDSEAAFDKIERNSLLLIDLDGKGQWFRLHRLVSDFLMARHPAENKDRLLKKASRWYEDKGLIQEAIKYSMMVSGIESVNRLMRLEVERTFQKGSFGSLSALFEKYGEDVYKDNFELNVYFGWSRFLAGDFENLEMLIADLEKEFHTCQDDDVLHIFQLLQTVKDNSRGELLSLNETGDLLRNEKRHDRSFRIITMLVYGIGLFRKNRLDDAIKQFATAKKAAEETGNTFLLHCLVHHMAICYLDQGDKEKAINLCNDSIDSYRDFNGNELPFSGMIHISLSYIFYDSGDLEKALVHGEQGYKYCAQLNLHHLLLDDGTLILSRLWMESGNLENAKMLLSRIENVETGQLLTRFYGKASALQALLHLRAGQTDELLPWLKARKKFFENSPDETPLLSLWEMEVYIYSLIQTDECREASELLNRLFDQSAGKRLSVRLIRFYILMTLLSKKLDDEDGALTTLKKALSLLDETGSVSPFMEYYGDIRGYLYKLRKGYQKSVDKLMDSYYGRTEKREKDSAEPVKLSRREKEILKLVSRGYSNGEISENLFISIGTVKWHVNNIFVKLDVKNRTEAAAAATSMKLI